MTSKTTKKPTGPSAAKNGLAFFATFKNALMQAVQRYHGLYYLLRSIGKLPQPVLEQLCTAISAPNRDDYPNSDAHLRLLLGLSQWDKQPINQVRLVPVRQQYHTASTSIQAPPNDGVVVHERTTTAADGSPMILRCYQPTIPSMPNRPHRSHAARPIDPNNDQVAILFMHGGGFCIGDLDTHDEFCRYLCAQTRWPVVSVDYRLAPEHPAPSALDDCLLAYRWLSEHAEVFAARAERIVVAGDSAGGCLATLIAQQVVGHAVLPPPLAQLLLYPATDVRHDYPSRQRYQTGLPLTGDDVAMFTHSYLANSGLDDTSPLVVPINGDCQGLPPAWVVIAEYDMLFDEGVKYAQQMAAAGVREQQYVVRGAVHGFIHFIGVHTGTRQVCEQMLGEFTRFVRPLLCQSAQ